jgi:hypothetical protein
MSRVSSAFAGWLTGFSETAESAGRLALLFLCFFKALVELPN